MPFALPYSVPLLVFGARWNGADWAFRSVIWVFFGALLADAVIRADKKASVGGSHLAERMLTVPWVLIQAALILTGLFSMIRAQATAAGLRDTFIVTCVAVGATGGMFGIPVAHELMHRRNRFDRFLAEALMSLFSYTHFCIEHVEGHHSNVGTRRDPATARYGETLYAFLPRTVLGGLASAWRLECVRLRRQNRPVVSLYNRMLWYAAAVGALYAAVGAWFGLVGVVFFAAQGAISVLIIETLNYIEHYGLVRQESDGHAEAVGYRHSWDTAHAVSAWLLFNVARHSDHHVHPNKGYLSLEGRSEAPQLPAGYFSLFVLALFPPLWRRVIDPRLETGGLR